MEPEVIVTNTMVRKVDAFVRDLFAQKVSPEYTYHTIDHTLRVVRKLDELAERTGCDTDEREMLALSAYFHDSGFSEVYDNHEDESKRIARSFLESEHYPEKKIEVVLGCIEATKMDVMPSNQLHMLIKDADTSSLGSRNFFEYTEYLRQELNTVKGEQLDEMGWDYINLQFMKDHKFFTEAARVRFGPMKKQNVKAIERKLGLRQKKSKRNKQVGTIASNKSAQTQFKTALRNHIDLSAIADNKANTMLSVAALIISLSLPILGTNLKDYPHLLYPTIFLLFVCVISITYATLAIRPISTKGVTTVEDINKKQSNLFFFGNFYRMRYKDYEEGIKYVVSNAEFLDSSITRDLFFLGVALGRKYIFLRKCYNVFMFGMILSVLAFAVAFALGAPDPDVTLPTG